MRVGKLRHRISLGIVSLTQDAYGGVHQNTTTPFATVWGEVTDLAGELVYTASQEHSQITTKITVRFYSGISPDMIATVTMDQRTRTFDILGVTDPDGRRVMLELSCKERFD